MIILTAGHTGAHTSAQCTETHFDEGTENIWLRNRIAEILTNKYNLIVLIDNDHASLQLLTKGLSRDTACRVLSVARPNERLKPIPISADTIEITLHSRDTACCVRSPQRSKNNPPSVEIQRALLTKSNSESLNPNGKKSFKSVESVGDNHSEGVTSVRKKEISVGREKISVRVSRKLEEVFGCGDVVVCDGLSGKRLFGRAVWWNLKRRPLGLLAGVCAFLWSFVRNYICTNTGFAIGFTGPDGVGKTTVIEMLIGRLGGVFRTAHSYLHFRPMLFGNLGEVAHSAGLKREVDRNYNDPHRGKKVGVLSSLVRLAYYSVDYIVGYWLKVKSQIRITRLVVFDRYYTDVICDSRRSRIFLNYKFLYWFGRVFIPQLDYNILLTAEVDTILARKQELTEEGIRAINERIDYLAGKKGYRKFLNEGGPEETVTEILEWVFEEQHKRNLKRLF